MRSPCLYSSMVWPTYCKGRKETSYHFPCWLQITANYQAQTRDKTNLYVHNTDVHLWPSPVMRLTIEMCKMKRQLTQYRAPTFEILLFRLRSSSTTQQNRMSCTKFHCWRFPCVSRATSFINTKWVQAGSQTLHQVVPSHSKLFQDLRHYSWSFNWINSLQIISSYNGSISFQAVWSDSTHICSLTQFHQVMISEGRKKHAGHLQQLPSVHFTQLAELFYSPSFRT